MEKSSQVLNVLHHILIRVIVIVGVVVGVGGVAVPLLLFVDSLGMMEVAELYVCVMRIDVGGCDED